MSKIILDKFNELITNGLTKKEICEYFKVSNTTVERFVKKYNINIKFKENKKITLSNIQEEVINGALLGDGSLSKYNNRGNSRFVYNSSKKEHVEYVGLYFNDYLIESSKKLKEIERYDKRTNKIYTNYVIKTQLNKTFSDLYDKWYFNNEKIIPEINLSSLTCKIWYIGDGYVDNVKPFTRCIKLYTDNFNVKYIDDVLLPQLKYFKAKKYFRYKHIKDKHSFIVIPGNKCIDFIDYIGEVPIDIFKYKWIINRK